jgi:hypothetical protein
VGSCMFRCCWAEHAVTATSTSQTLHCLFKKQYLPIHFDTTDPQVGSRIFIPTKNDGSKQGNHRAIALCRHIALQCGWRGVKFGAWIDLPSGAG